MINTEQIKLEVLKNVGKLSSLTSRNKRGFNFKDIVVEPSVDDLIIDGIGGNIAVSKLLDISVPAISYWRKNGIPKGKLAILYMLSKEK